MPAIQTKLHLKPNGVFSHIFTVKYIDHVFSHLIPVVCVDPLSPSSDGSQFSHCGIKGLSVRKIMRIENMITQVKFA